MGGLGPGYEQCIQITAAEMLRWFVQNNVDASKWSDKKKWQATTDAIDASVMKSDEIRKLQLSGAQYGAALSLSSAFYKRGPAAAMSDENVKDRLIQVAKIFP